MNQNTITKISTSIIPVLIVLLIGCQSKNKVNEMENIDSIIAKVKQTWAPDKRVAIFKIENELVDSIQVLTGETNLESAHADLVKKLTKAKIKFDDQIKLLPSEELGEKHYGLVRISVANIRSEPAHSAELATQALLGTALKVYKKDSYWYLVQTPDGYISWVDASGIQLMTEQEKDDWIKADKIIYLEDSGYAFETTAENERVSDLVAGDLLILLDETEKHYAVEFPDGRTAFIPRGAAQPFDNWLKDTSPTPENLVADARRFIGLPYLWGGTSTKNFDCSGFTKTIYFLNGVVLARDASQQVHTGDPVDTEKGFEKLEVGDLLFFGRAATDSTSERITHVGIYIGDTEFIHASGLVKINSLDPTRSNFNQYRYDNFIRARRVLSSLNKNGIVMVKDHPAYVQQ